jgi:hypothetical protein
MFSADVFMENLFSTYDSYLKSKSSEIHEPIILKSKKFLSKKDFAKFMIGTINLLAMENKNGFFLRDNYIKNIIEKSSKENQLRIAMTNEVYKKYAPLIETKILNTKF